MLLALRPFERLRAAMGTLVPAKRGSKRATRIERADLLEGEIGGEAVPIGGAVDGQIVQDDRLSVLGQHDVDLHGRGAGRLGGLERRQRVLRDSEGCIRDVRRRGRARPRGQES